MSSVHVQSHVYPIAAIILCDMTVNGLWLLNLSFEVINKGQCCPAIANVARLFHFFALCRCNHDACNLCSICFLQFRDLIDEVYTQYSKVAFSELAPGTLCEFHGRYRYSVVPLSVCGDEQLDYVELASTYYRIPKKTCQVQDSLFSKCCKLVLIVMTTFFTIRY